MVTFLRAIVTATDTAFAVPTRRKLARVPIAMCETMAAPDPSGGESGATVKTGECGKTAIVTAIRSETGAGQIDAIVQHGGAYLMVYDEIRGGQNLRAGTVIRGGRPGREGGRDHLPIPERAVPTARQTAKRRSDVAGNGEKGADARRRR